MFLFFIFHFLFFGLSFFLLSIWILFFILCFLFWVSYFLFFGFSYCFFFFPKIKNKKKKKMKNKKQYMKNENQKNENQKAKIVPWVNMCLWVRIAPSNAKPENGCCCRSHKLKSILTWILVKSETNFDWKIWLEIWRSRF